jgi:group I intron endonuclease
VIGVYQIELNGKKYIGSSVNVKKRFCGHLSQLRRGKHDNPHLQRAFIKYGEETLKFSILETLRESSDCIYTEQKYIDYLKPEYNIRKIAKNNLGLRRTKESKLRSKMANLGRQYRLGSIVSEETKQKMSQKKMGNKCRLGKTHTEETKKKMSDARIKYYTTLRQKLIQRGDADNDCWEVSGP